MTNLTRFTNGKVSNKAINVIANTAGMAATAFAVVAATAVFTPSAEAQVQNCWILERTGESTKPFSCDVNKRRLSDDTVVLDIRHFQGQGAYFTVRLWQNDGKPSGADIWLEGKQYQAEYYTDKDGDTRLDLGEYGEFVF